MTTNDRRHLINVHSSVKGKVPGVEAADMRYGELAVNHSKGNAFLSTRVSDTEMEVFPSLNYLGQNPLSSLAVKESTSLSGTTKIEQIVAGDNTFDNQLSKTSVNAVQNKVIAQVISDNEKIVSASLNDLNERKLDASAYTPTDLSDYYKKEETSGKSEISDALNLKANASDLTAHTGKTDIHTSTTEREKWNAAATKVQIIDTELRTDSSNLVVNSAITKTIQDNEEAVSTSLNDLNKRKANASDLAAHTGNSTVHITDAERTKWNGKFSNVNYTSGNKRINFYSGATTENPVAYIDASSFVGTQPGSPTVDLSNYYTKDQTSGSTQLTTAFNSKANASDLATKANKSDLDAHTKNTDIHITNDERNLWNNAKDSLRTHENNLTIHINADEKKAWNAAAKKVETIDTELSATSNNLVVNSAITKTIQDNEEAVSASLNDLNKRKLDATAYTPTDLSDYYKKEETSGKTALDTAFGQKANSTDLTTHTGNKTVHITADERTKWDGKFSNVQYDSTSKSINFYSGTTAEKAVASIDANDFIRDATGTIDLTKYYKKTETSGNTQLTDAFNLKADNSALTAHTNNSTIHISGDERTKWDNAVTTLTTHTGNTSIHIDPDEKVKWNNAYANRHTHENKTVLDKITGIDTELKTDSSNLVVNSAITAAIQDNEEAISASLNDLNKRKLDASGLTSHTGDSTIHITSNERTKWNGKLSSAQYNKTDKKIYFYSGATSETPVSTIDATDFIKDGMVSNVEIKNVTNSGSCLVITFNADSGKQDINIPISTIFNPANYYLKTETSGKTELDTALGLKADESKLTAHTSDEIHHITSTERINWNNARTALTTHLANLTVHINADERKAWNAAADKVKTIDTTLDASSNRLVVNSAITKAIQENEEAISAALNDLNKRLKIIETKLGL